MSKGDLFHVADLHDLRDISLVLKYAITFLIWKVLNNLCCLASHARTISEFRGPYLELITPKSVRIRTNEESPKIKRFCVKLKLFLTLNSGVTVSQIDAKKRPGLPASFVSSDPAAQFKMQQEAQIREEMENRVFSLFCELL
jgi:hypothetical protein